MVAVLSSEVGARGPEILYVITASKIWQLLT
jgi:hypothetical protein